MVLHLVTKSLTLWLAVDFIFHARTVAASVAHLIIMTIRTLLASWVETFDIGDLDQNPVGSPPQMGWWTALDSFIA